MANAAESSRGLVRLGRARVDLDAERIVDPAGQTVALRPQAFAVLRLLLANPERLVTKDEVMQAVWPGIAVTDDSLVQCIGEIRKALGDDDRTLIETVPRRGYRLTQGPSAAHGGASRERRAAIFGAALVLAALAVGAWRMLGPDVAPLRTPRIAVMPFSAAAGAGSEYLGPGVAEDVISMLARSPDVAVIARSSSFALGDAPRDVREIAETLGVDYVLEGSVRREGDSLRVIAQLDDAKTGEHVWAERFDRAGPDPWALADEVSGKIIFALAGEKGEIKRAQFREAWGKDTTQLGEYDYYLRGLDVYMSAEDAAEVARGGRIWEEGLAQYPESALLKVQLAWAHWTAAWLFWTDLERNFAEADRLVSEVLARDDLSPETQRVAHWLNAYVLMQRGEFNDAVWEAERTIELAPYDARVLRQLTDILLADGRYDMALEWLARAEPREPGREVEYVIQRALVQRLMGRYEEADRTYASAGEGMRVYPRLSWAITLVRLGRREEAREKVRWALEEEPDFTRTTWREGSFYSDPAILDAEVAALAEAGLPEG